MSRKIALILVGVLLAGGTLAVVVKYRSDAAQDRHRRKELASALTMIQREGYGVRFVSNYKLELEGEQSDVEPGVVVALNEPIGWVSIGDEGAITYRLVGIDNAGVAIAYSGYYFTGEGKHEWSGTVRLPYTHDLGER